MSKLPKVTWLKLAQVGMIHPKQLWGSGDAGQKPLKVLFQILFHLAHVQDVWVNLPFLVK